MPGATMQRLDKAIALPDLPKRAMVICRRGKQIKPTTSGSGMLAIWVMPGTTTRFPIGFDCNVLLIGMPNIITLMNICTS